MSPSSRPSFRTILLVGFMASGKSTVGRRVARRLGWEFVDVDALLEDRFGTPVGEIFQEHGEARFREAEEDVTRKALEVPGRVVASGGGWGGVPGRIQDLDASILTVWLQVTPATAVERTRMDSHVRPLLAGNDPVERARRLLQQRAPAYRNATLHLDSEAAPPERLALDIVEYSTGRDRTGPDPDPGRPDDERTKAPPSGTP